jgi:hypothetical protein
MSKTHEGTPVAAAPVQTGPSEAEAKKAAKKAEKEAAKAAKEAAKEASKAQKIEANGVVRPKSGTKTGRVWEISDELSAALKRPVERKLVMEAAAKESINEATCATQYGRWRKYHGLKGQLATPPAAAPDVTPAPA